MVSLPDAEESSASMITGMDTQARGLVYTAVDMGSVNSGAVVSGTVTMVVGAWVVVGCCVGVASWLHAANANVMHRHISSAVIFFMDDLLAVFL